MQAVLQNVVAALLHEETEQLGTENAQENAKQDGGSHGENHAGAHALPDSLFLFRAEILSHIGRDGRAKGINRLQAELFKLVSGCIARDDAHAEGVDR